MHLYPQIIITNHSAIQSKVVTLVLLGGPDQSFLCLCLYLYKSLLYFFFSGYNLILFRKHQSMIPAGTLDFACSSSKSWRPILKKFKEKKTKKQRWGSQAKRGRKNETVACAQAACDPLWGPPLAMPDGSRCGFVTVGNFQKRNRFYAREKRNGSPWALGSRSTRCWVHWQMASVGV